MKLITVAGAALNQTPMDWAGNTRNIVGAIAAARDAGAAVLCLPEMCITGYGCEDQFASADLRARAGRQLAEILPETKGMAVSLGLPIFHRNAVFNGVALAVDGELAGVVLKRHLAGEGLHYEPRWFKPWPGGVRAEIELGGATTPIGDLWFEVGEGAARFSLGFEICEDAWVAERPGAALSRLGVDLILNPSASHFAFGKRAVREQFVVEGSRAFGVTYIYSNLLGNEAGRAIYDGGVMIASGGRLLAQGPRLTFDRWLVTAATIDLDAMRTAQSRIASFGPDLSDARPPVRVELNWVEPAKAAALLNRTPWETCALVKEEEFTRAVALGLFDYLRKSRSSGFVVSLSGGADSSAVVALVALMARLAESQRPGALAEALPWMATARGGKVGLSDLLTTVYQATKNSSSETRVRAAALAAAVGCGHHEFEIDGLVERYTNMVEGAVGRALSWEKDDLALQNIQARVRAPGVWMLANIKNALLLSTSNRSEAAVGYATMDGDTCGGLSPIAGIDKAFLLQWLAWMGREGPAGVGPVAELAMIPKPSPELRPPAAGQTSEGDLMPYEVLEAIEDLAITGKLAPAEVVRSLVAAGSPFERGVLVGFVVKFFRLWCRNQWKRERYAPSFHLDDHNLDPKTWCRFPILSGGFERELAELESENNINLGTVEQGVRAKSTG